MNRRLLLPLLFLQALPLLSACRDKYRIPSELEGGSVELNVRDGQSFLVGQFWAERSGEDFDYGRLPMTGCMYLPHPAVERGFLEVGPDIQVEIGPDKVSLGVVKDDQGQPSYQPSESDWRAFFGQSYDVAIGETRWKSRLRLPRPLRINSEDPAFTFEEGKPFELKYQPVSADHLLLRLVSGTAGTVCHLGPEGQFRIPATVIEASPAEGSLVLEAEDEDQVALGGHPVSLRGVVQVTRPYKRVRPGHSPRHHEHR